MFNSKLSTLYGQADWELGMCRGCNRRDGICSPRDPFLTLPVLLKTGKIQVEGRDGAATGLKRKDQRGVEPLAGIERNAEPNVMHVTGAATLQACDLWWTPGPLSLCFVLGKVDINIYSTGLWVGGTIQ